MSPGSDPTVTALTDDEVASWRRRFPILQRCTYLISNSLGAMPEGVPEALGRYTAEWAAEGVEAWQRWFPEVHATAALLEGLLAAPAGSVMVHQNVSTLVAMVVSALATSGRNTVVLSDTEWPSHRYLLARYAETGLRTRVVPTDGVHVDAEALAAAVDDDTLLVICSHVTYHSGCIVDVDRVCARARAMGAFSLVDGYHALGHLPVDVTAIGCDFYTGGSVKWLCGGPGVAYLYVRPDTAAAIAPRDVGWLGHARPFAFEDTWEPAAGAWSWLGGTPAVPAVYAAREGYRVIAEVTPERIRATSLPLTARLVAGAAEAGWTVRTPLDAARRAGAVVIDRGGDTEAWSRRLIDAGIVVDYRPGAGIRVGPHFYNTVEECDRLLAALRR